MTDTRMVALEQIVAGPIENANIRDATVICCETVSTFKTIMIRCKQIADPTGGDVFEPINSLEAGLAEALRRANWKHPVQVEVING